MIVDPDMPDHWKTRMLVDLLGGDELAPLYLIRLWGHCQNRKAWIFDGLPPAAVKAICRFSGDAKALDDALIECGFMERDEKQITVVGWEERNASMVKSWENGKRGGRPKKAPTETEDKPEENPEETQTETQEEPSDNPRETDKRREDKRREDSPQTPQGGQTKYSPEFDEFWSAYPRKTGKGEAWKRWKKINPGVELRAKMLWALEAQKRSHDWLKDNGQYIPHPSTWLNQDRWEDELPMAGQGPPAAAPKAAPDNPYGDF